MNEAPVTPQSRDPACAAGQVDPPPTSPKRKPCRVSARVFALYYSSLSFKSSFFITPATGFSISKQEGAGNSKEAEALRKSGIQSGLLKGAGFGATMEASQNKGGKDNGTGIHGGTEEKSLRASEGKHGKESGDVAGRAGSLPKGIQQAANPGRAGENGDLRSTRPYLSGNNALNSLKPGARKVAEETQRRRVAEYKADFIAKSAHEEKPI